MGKRTYRMNRKATRRIFRNPHGFDANAFRSGISEKSMTLTPENQAKVNAVFLNLHKPVPKVFGECERCGEFADFSQVGFSLYGEYLCDNCVG